MKIICYDSELKQQWDDFVETSKNGTFILKRDYMEYHSDRFQDFSLMFFEDDKLIALLPLSVHGNEVKSHGGLTYGGIISDLKMTTPKMLEVFDGFKFFLKEKGFFKLLYKRVPQIFHDYPADEDKFALFVNNAKLVSCNVSTTVFIEEKIDFNERRRRNIKKAVKAGLEVRESEDFRSYMELLQEVLRTKHGAKPVHTLDEILYLKGKFPHNIRLFSAFDVNEMLAGVIIYESRNTAHCQYIASGEKGRKTGALDLGFDYLINDIYKHKRYFDFGTSNEKDGSVNLGLITQKQEFGGRAVVHELYEIIL